MDPGLALRPSGEADASTDAPDAWLITDGKIGDEVPMRGLAAAMGLAAEPRHIRPRKPFAAMAPWGPADPRDLNRLCHPPFPAIGFAAGRRTVPVLRALKTASPKTFTIFLGNPRTARHGADSIWAPAHDGLAGPAIISTPTTPHPYSPAALAALREAPDPRIAVLPVPRAGLLIGGTSRHHKFGPAEIDSLTAAVRTIRAQGFGLAATVSRRTPPALAERLRAQVSGDPGVFLWTGEGQNPYGSILACADALLVTADSTNMLSEAVATGVPVHVFTPSGGHPRLAHLLDSLAARGSVRPWKGMLERWTSQPVDSTSQVAAELARRFRAFQQAQLPNWRDGPGTPTLEW